MCLHLSRGPQQNSSYCTCLSRRVERIESKGRLWQCLFERSCCIPWKSRVRQILDAERHLLLRLRLRHCSTLAISRSFAPLHYRLSYTCNALPFCIGLPYPPSKFCCQRSDSRVAMFTAKVKVMLPQ